VTDRLIIKVDSQILNSMDLCPERWRMEFRENWKPQQKAIALERGILMHKMLDHFYKQRMAGRTRPADMPMLVEECLMVGRMVATASTHIDVKEFNEDIRVFKEYFLRWQYDGWEIHAVETPFSKPLYDSAKLLILYEGIIDLIVTDPKLGKVVVDTKTESRESTPFVLSNQFEGYQWATGLPLIINKIGYQQNAKMEVAEGGKERVDMRFRRILHEVDKEAIQEWREDAIKQIIESIGWEQDILAGKRLRKNRTSCDKWGGCIYQKVCKEPSEVREHKLITKFFRDKPWDVFERDAPESIVEHDETAAF
jgi:RecB family exonuclease